VWVEAVPLFGAVGAMDAVGIDLPMANMGKQDVPVVVGPVAFWIQHIGLRGFTLIALIKEEQLYRSRVGSKDAEVGPTRRDGGPQRERRASKRVVGGASILSSRGCKLAHGAPSEMTSSTRGLPMAQLG